MRLFSGDGVREGAAAEVEGIGSMFVEPRTSKDGTQNEGERTHTRVGSEIPKDEATEARGADLETDDRGTTGSTSKLSSNTRQQQVRGGGETESEGDNTRRRGKPRGTPKATLASLIS